MPFKNFQNARDGHNPAGCQPATQQAASLRYA
jgi:hypothetical protein